MGAVGGCIWDLIVPLHFARGIQVMEKRGPRIPNVLLIGLDALRFAAHVGIVRFEQHQGGRHVGSATQQRAHARAKGAPS